MVFITFQLHHKTLTVRAADGAFVQKLSFQAQLPKGHRLYSQVGKDVASGYVELVAQKPNHDTETLWFNEETENPDTGVVEPPNVSFYALVSAELFALIRDSHPSMSLELRINTGLAAPLRFDDPFGRNIRWDVTNHNPIRVESYELVITAPGSVGPELKS